MVKITQMFGIAFLQLFADAGTLVNASENYVNAYTGSTTAFKGGGGIWTGYISWSSTTDTASNTSTVTAYVYTAKTNGEGTEGTFSGHVSIGGVTTAFYYSFEDTKYTQRPEGSGYVTTGPYPPTATITHNADGSASCKIEATINSPGGASISDYTLTGEATVTLDTIARVSTLTASAADVQMGKQLILTVNRQDASFRHTICYAPTSGVNWVTIAENVSGSCTWTVPDLAANCDNGTQLVVYLIVHTYTSAGAYIGYSYLTGAYTDANGGGYILAGVQDPTVPSVSGDVTLGVGQAISCPRNSTNFTVKLTFTLDSWTETILEDKVSSCTWTPSYDIAKIIPICRIITRWRWTGIRRKATNC